MAFAVLPRRQAALDYVKDGWLVGVHHIFRKQAYHPVPGHVSVRHEELDNWRMMACFFTVAKRRLCEDDWRQDVRFDDSEMWRGYAFIQVNCGGTYADRGALPRLQQDLRDPCTHWCSPL